MRILHVISTLQMGGAEHLLVDLLPALRDQGNEVELLLINGARTPFYTELEQRGIVIHHIQERGRIYSPMHLFRVKKYLNDYDIIHTHTSPCQFLMACAKSLYRTKTHLVTTEHSTTNHRRNKAWLKPLDKWMYSQYEGIICISDKSRECLVKHLGSDKGVVVINNGIDFQKFTNPVKCELNKIKVITMVASMRDAKDQDTVIRAMTLLDGSYKLRLVGDGPRRSLLEHLAKEMNVNVEFTGNQNDIPQILKESDLVVLSSHWEGLSLASIEGMASGRPFIASDVPGLKEIVNGYGILFHHSDYQNLAQKIKLLTSNIKHYQETAIRCQERAKLFDIRLTAQKYNETYKSICKKKI